MMILRFLRLSVLALTLFPLGEWGLAAEFNWQSYKPEPVYLAPDKGQLNPPPRPKKKKEWVEKIFSDKIIAQFRRKYEEEFGSFEAIYITSAFPDTGFVRERGGIDYQSQMIENDRKMQEIGEFISLKILEYQVDSYLRSNPRTKEAYDIKVAVTNLETKPSDDTELKFNYDISGNYAEAIYVTPWLTPQVKWEMKSLGEGLFQVDEVLYSVARKLPWWSVNVEVLYQERKDEIFVIASRRINKRWTSSITLSKETSATDEDGVEINVIDKSAILGISFNL